MAGARELPTTFLRLEGAVLFGLSLFLYVRGNRGWVLFVVLVLAPDLSLLGYAAGRRVGAVVYNLGHTYLGPAAVAVSGIIAESGLAVSIALIWFAHIGMDRMLGYGLKQPTGFRDTHLGRIGAD
jgi:hypothetical protein